jgi:FtsZ-binding cell division protein ZapB
MNNQKRDLKIDFLNKLIENPMGEVVDNPISQFLLDMLNRSLNSQLGVCENFVFNNLRDINNFKIAFSILYSAFQQNLLQDSQNYTSWNEILENQFPEELEYVILTKHELLQLQASQLTRENSDFQSQINQIKEENNQLREEKSNLQSQINSLQQENDQPRQENSNIQSQTSQLQQENNQSNIESQIN